MRPGRVQPPLVEWLLPIHRHRHGHDPPDLPRRGVDIDAGNEVVERIKPLVKRTFRPR
jgi:hypothetical protein